MKWYLDVLKKYVVFQGRARRQEFWMFVLFNVIFSFVAALLDNLLGLNVNSSYGSSYVSTGYISMVYSLAVFLPTLGVTVRRLHDVGKSGWMILVALIPFVGWIWLIVLEATAGQPGPNQYGPDPKGGVAVPPVPVQ